jgi:hypothetical protein
LRRGAGCDFAPPAGADRGRHRGVPGGSGLASSGLFRARGSLARVTVEGDPSSLAYRGTGGTVSLDTRPSEAEDH